MIYGSLFAGVGGFDAGFEQAGHQCLWQVEIDAKCRMVLKRHFPDADRSVTDVTAAGKHNLKKVDAVVGGSPCQGFSVAGLRASMEDDRSNLCLQYVRICNELEPTVVVWENVVGVLSTPDNAFGCFLAGLAGADAPLVPAIGQKWTRAGMVDGPRRAIAWRVQDSQYHGVAQRRERVFLVASARKELPFQVLFEPESLRRHSPSRRETRQDTASATGGGSEAGGESGIRETGPTLSSRNKGGGGLGDAELNGALIPDVAPTLLGGDNATGGYETAPPLTASGRGTERAGESRGQDCVIPDVCHKGFFDRAAQTTGPIMSDGKRMPGTQPDDAESLVVTPINMQNVTRDESGGARLGSGIGEAGEPANTIQAGHSHAVAITPINMQAAAKCGEKSPNMLGIGQPGDPAYTVNASDQHAVAILPQDAVAFQSSQSGVMEQGDRTAALNTATDPNQNIVGVGIDGSEVGFALRSNASHSGDKGDGGVNTTMAVVSCVALESLTLQGLCDMILEYANAIKANPDQILQILQCFAGQETLSGREMGSTIPLQPTQVLRPEVHGGTMGEGCPQQYLRTVECKEPGAPPETERPMREMREAEHKGCPPQGRESEQQPTIKPDANLPELPQQDSSPEAVMQTLRKTDEGTRLLRGALSAIQKMGRPIAGEGQPICPSKEGRRTESCEEVPGLRPAYECERLLRAMLHASQAGRNTLRERISGVSSAYGVRRLTPL